jgi:hypothetical protein
LVKEASGAQVAKVKYTAFTSRKGRAITARLIVRRVRDPNRRAAATPPRHSWLTIRRTGRSASQFPASPMTDSKNPS